MYRMIDFGSEKPELNIKPSTTGHTVRLRAASLMFTVSPSVRAILAVFCLERQMLVGACLMLADARWLPK